MTEALPKPRLKRFPSQGFAGAELWSCADAVVTAYGVTSEEAYEEWVSRRKIEDRVVHLSLTTRMTRREAVDQVLAEQRVCQDRGPLTAEELSGKHPANPHETVKQLS